MQAHCNCEDASGPIGDQLEDVLRASEVLFFVPQQDSKECALMDSNQLLSPPLRRQWLKKYVVASDEARSTDQLALFGRVTARLDRAAGERLIVFSHAVTEAH